MLARPAIVFVALVAMLVQLASAALPARAAADDLVTICTGNGLRVIHGHGAPIQDIPHRHEHCTLCLHAAVADLPVLPKLARATVAWAVTLLPIRAAASPIVTASLPPPARGPPAG